MLAEYDAGQVKYTPNKGTEKVAPVMFLTGVLLLITQATKAYGNPFFRTKLIFLLLLGINAALYQKLLYPKMADWDSAHGAPAGAKFCAAFSLVLWIGVIVCGRTMAYQF